MKKLYFRLREHTIRELEIVVKNPSMIMILLVVPLFYSAFFGSVFLYKGQWKIPIVVVDNDQTSLSRQIIRYMDAHPKFSVEMVTKQENEARDELEKLNNFAVILVPDDFSKNVKSGREVSILANVNAGRFLLAGDVVMALQETVGTVNAGIRIKTLQAGGMSGKQAKEYALPVNVDDRPLYNTKSTYGEFFIPLLLMVVIQQVMMMAIAISVSNEKQEKIISEWKRNSNNSVINGLLGKTTLYFLSFVIYSIVTFSLSFHFYDLPVHGNLIALGIVNMLHLAGMAAMAFFISSFIRYRFLAIQIFIFMTYPLFMASGGSWPLDQMPVWFATFMRLFPSTPGLVGYQHLTLMGAGFVDVLPLIGNLILVLVFWSALALWRCKKLFQTV